MKTVFRNAWLVEEESVRKADVWIEGERVTALTEAGTPGFSSESLRIVEAEGKYLLPGLIDTHVHFREPGLTAKADIASESAAAVAGGVTSYFDMPNTQPQTVTLADWEDKMRIAARSSLANYAFYLGASAGHFGQLEQADYQKVPGIKLFMGSSTGGMMIDGQKNLEQCFQTAARLDIPLAVHCESEAVIRANRENLLREHRLSHPEADSDDLPIEWHPKVRSTEACAVSSRLAVELAHRFGTRLHILHISTAEELSLLEKGPMENKQITAETCPHYLWFDSKDYATLGSRIKCNPAIKEASDRLALLQALKEGRIDTLGTDHAPHRWSDKQGGCLKAASGSPSIQFALPVLLELCARGQMSLENIVGKYCHAPARLFRLRDRGFIRPGAYADLVLVNPDVLTRVRPEIILSKCGWSPFEGCSFRGAVEQTWVNGELRYKRMEGILPGQSAQALSFSRQPFRPQA